MSAYLGPNHVGFNINSDHDDSRRDAQRQLLREYEERPSFEEAGELQEQSDDTANDTLPVLSTKVEDDDNDSIWSRENIDDGDEPLTPNPLPVRPLGLSRRTGYTKFDDYDVVTVHGARDDHQTAWTAPDDGSNWILDKLFTGFSVRQLDYVYDTSNSARIYDPSADGITAEANALLDSLARNRAELPPTETDRPIIWICHDLGGSIVKQVLINAIHKQPDPAHDDDPEYSKAIRRIYRRLPLLTTSIVFLACPHGNESTEELEDELFALMHLSGPPVSTQTLKKIENLSLQIERINLEFLETKVLDRAVIVNITTAAEKEKQTDTVVAPQTAQHSTENSQVGKPTIDPPTTPSHLFSMNNSAKLHNLGLYYTTVLRGTDHLGLVRGPDYLDDWANALFHLFNQRPGFNIGNRYAYLAFQNSLLSLSPPTRLNKFQFYTGGFSQPAVISWIIEQDSLIKKYDRKNESKIVYLHGGVSGRQIIDMKLVSQHLYTAFDIVEHGAREREPVYGCFYFEFDQHDSRRAGIKDMIMLFMCTFAGRFWTTNTDFCIVRSADYLWRFRSWSLRDLVNVFLDVQQTDSMNAMTIILGGIDECDKAERSILLQAILDRRNRSELWFNLVMTTNSPDDFISDILPPENIISLHCCPLSLDDYLAYPSQTATEDRIQRLLVRRPEFTHIRPQLYEIFGKFRAAPGLQETVLEWFANYKRGTSSDEITDITREVASHAHQNLLKGLIDQLSVDKQQIMTLIFDWVKYAAEPVTLEILAEAIRYSLPQIGQLQLIQDHEDFNKLVEETLGGIILRDGRGLKFSDDAFYNVSVVSGFSAEQDQKYRSHADMASVCLRYLLGTEGQEMLTSLSMDQQCMDDLSWSPIALPRHSLVSYALRFWTVHYRAAGDYRPIDLATELLQDTLKRRAWTEAVYVVSNPFTRMQREYISLLPYLAMFGLDDLVHKHIENEERQKGLTQDCWLAVAEAARNGHGPTVALLLEHTEIDADGLREALYWAARYGEGEALECLISKAQELEDFSWPPSILAHAIVAGLENLVLALVQSGHDLNEAGYDLDKDDSTRDWRAVHIAVEFGQDRLLKILLDSGRVDLGLKNDRGQTPLVLAAEVGSAASIRHLLDAGASLKDVESLEELLFKTIDGGNYNALEVLINASIYSTNLLTNPIPDDYQTILPIFLAVRRCLVECVRVLLDNGVDPNVTCADGSILYQAIDRGPNLIVCRMLLEKGADPNEPSAEQPLYRDMVLMRAIQTGHKYLVEMLLDHGAKINVTDPNRDLYDTPLSCAIQDDHYDIMELLLERGADPNLRSEDKSDSYPALFSAAFYCRDARFFETLIKYGANMNWTRDNDGWSVLHAGYDSADVVSLLLQNGADINAAAKYGETTLTYAVKFEKKESIEVLMKHTNPKPDLVTIKDYQGMTPLHHACRNHDGDTIKLLLEAGADINQQEVNDELPLALLLRSGLALSAGPGATEDIVNFMLQHRPNLDLLDWNRCTVLHSVTRDTPLSAVMRLVEAGAPVNTANNSGQTPLYTAIYCGNIDVARYLTTVKGVQSNFYLSHWGCILHMAVEESTVDMVKQLVRTGAEHGVVDPEEPESVVYHAVRNNSTRESRKIMRYLVEELGADVNATGGGWVCPLLLAVAECRGNSVLKYLLRHGARTDPVDNLGRTAVHWAVINQQFDQLKTLAEFGADFSVADGFGYTPLHFAASNDNMEILRYTLEKLPNGAASVNVADVDGWTPLMWACRSGDDDHAAAFVLINEYEADTCVRSKDGKWSPLKLARLHDWEDGLTEALVASIHAQAREESHVISQDQATSPGTRQWRNCDGCTQRCVGQTWVCKECDVEYLCFKCFGHGGRSGRTYNHEHTFVDVDEPDHLDANKSELGGQSGDGSESDERDESDESESEEEEEEEEEEDDEDTD